LTKHYHQQLIPTTKMFYIFIACIFNDKTVKKLVEVKIQPFVRKYIYLYSLPENYDFWQGKKFKSSRNYFALIMPIENDFKESLMILNGH